MTKFSMLALALGALTCGPITAHAADQAIPPKPAAATGKTTETKATETKASETTTKPGATKADAAPTSSAPIHKVSTETVDAYVKATFGKAPEEWQQRIVPDDTMKACNKFRNEVPTDVAEAIMQREIKKVAFPADGKLLGDWKAGAKIANNGRGGQFSDKADTVNGGNCYACHQMAPSEVSFGTLGPSLTHYGRDRNYTDAEIKQAYTKIYNSQAVVPCSNMPRFGTNGFLTEQQIKDVMAFLFDPESPVNK
ncbi:sulfur oxidation c-type cytochrome SoxX [Rhodopseudomonas palustris]|uniref:sulfur oxidation c-type cytochrome SoxX n=1 Tax=Rhodopseudomonas palustris TaxID=1076 RepID=UPI002ACDF54B|nr:sulfur oxidation c-type cytochrome SoxX [Rhodopseudomonas palustris]WQH02122.1 sulfur oxidation c-type cytochrome SoxX [Rhodopseudomonas palustris]